jgi:hypothetical protein
MTRMPLRLLYSLFAALLLSGCAASSVFFPYPAQAEKFRGGINAADTEAVLSALDQRRNDADKMLYLMERARLAQLAGRFDASKADFEAVLAAFREADDRARISLSGAGAAGSSLLTNDNAIPYKGQAYERVLVHQYQALNYLALGDRDGAAVELRNAQQLQRQAELDYAGELSKAQGDAAQNNVLLGDFDNHFAGMDAVTGKLKNSFQNGYTFYLSAVFWEALGEYNDALVDYKKALELAPENAALKQDVIRANGYFGGGQKPNAGEGSVVVFFEQGFVQAKRDININIPTTDGGWFAVAFPVYAAEDHVTPSALRIQGANRQVDTDVLVDTSALAMKSLKEQVPAMLVRQVLRARTKYEMQRQASKQGGLGAQLLTNIYNLVSEQADLRSWLTLPANAQAARLPLPAGQQTLTFFGSTGSISLPVDVRAGRTTLVRVVEANGRLLTQTFAL